jgi:hypothetical protein
MQKNVVQILSSSVVFMEHSKRLYTSLIFSRKGERARLIVIIVKYFTHEDTNLGYVCRDERRAVDTHHDTSPG